MTIPRTRSDLTTIAGRQHALLHATGHTHDYDGDGIPDEHGHDRCDRLGCGLPERHPVHNQEEANR